MFNYQKLGEFVEKHGERDARRFLRERYLGDQVSQYADVLPFGCEENLGVALLETVKNESNITSAKSTLRANIAIDCLVFGICVTAYLADGTKTMNLGIQIRDSLLDDNWFLTLGSQGRDALVPALCVAGSSGLPLEWPAPRILAAGEELFVDVAAEDGQTIKYFAVTFFGRRLRGIEYDFYRCLDPRASGYCAVALQPLPITWEAQGEEGPEKRFNNALERVPYDLLISRRSLIITTQSDAAAFTHVNGAEAVMGTENNTFRHDQQNELVPTSMYGGGLQDETLSNASGLRIPSTPEGACWRFSRLSSIALIGAMLRRPAASGDTEFFLKVVLHGQRIAPERLPDYLFEGYDGYEGVPCRSLEDIRVSDLISGGAGAQSQVFGGSSRLMRGGCGRRFSR